MTLQQLFFVAFTTEHLPDKNNLQIIAFSECLGNRTSIRTRMKRFKQDEIDAVMDYLASFTQYGFNADERNNYLNFSLDRFLKTLELIPDNITAASKVLELGASPYFMSLLIMKYLKCHVDYANYFGEKSQLRQEEVLVSEKYNERHVFRFKNFNIENERFPYKNKSYDLVLFCEIIEHLTVDPVHSLVQINRLLSDGGYLVVTTPNALRYENILKLLLGKNIYDHYSGYGAYGRHNREYTPSEMRILAESLGFRIIKLYTKVTGSIKIKDFSIKRFRGFMQLMTTRYRGSNIFLLAQKVSDARPVHPKWLFESWYDTAGINKR
jgi:SAM-dependent methyltransferase